MPRGPRYLPPGWSAEVTTRTVCGFYLLPATPAFARTIVGVLAQAQKAHPVQVHAAVAANNHYHLILTPEDEDQLSDFMEYFNGNLAREAGRPLDWHGGFWADRFHLVPISPEPEALIERMRYVLSNTVKENLVARIADWEGLHCAEALIEGKPLAGTWHDRGSEYEVQRQADRKAARRGKPIEPIKRGSFITPYELKLAPLPCWRNLPKAQMRKQIAQMVAEIEADAARLREKLGTEPVGMETIRNQNPLDRPMRSKRSPKPLCHAASKDMRERFRKARGGFIAMFQEASLKLRSGDVAGARFPKGCFPPSLPFVRTGEEFDPLADAGGSRRFAALLLAASG